MKSNLIFMLAAAVTAAAFTATAFTACATTPDSVPEDLSPREFFQRAQEAVVERSDYRTALLYYETFLERFPDDVQRGVEAEYEIAFIHYKLGEEETAEEMFRSLLSRYEGEGSEILPQWPRILAEKLLARIEGQSNTADLSQPATEAE